MWTIVIDDDGNGGAAPLTQKGDKTFGGLIIWSVMRSAYSGKSGLVEGVVGHEGTTEPLIWGPTEDVCKI